MAVLKIVKNDYSDSDTLKDLVNYIQNDDKTHGDIGAQGTSLSDPSECMYRVRNYFCQTEGKSVQHFILSFGEKDKTSLLDAMGLGYAVCALYPEYQVIFGVHHNTNHLHIHWAMNPVNTRTGKKFSFTYGETFGLRKGIARLLEPYNISCKLRIDERRIDLCSIMQKSIL